MCEHTLMCETGGYLPHTIKQYMYKYTIRCVHDYEIKKKKSMTDIFIFQIFLILYLMNYRIVLAQ